MELRVGKDGWGEREGGVDTVAEGEEDTLTLPLALGDTLPLPDALPLCNGEWEKDGEEEGNRGVGEGGAVVEPPKRDGVGEVVGEEEGLRDSVLDEQPLRDRVFVIVAQGDGEAEVVRCVDLDAVGEDAGEEELQLLVVKETEGEGEEDSELLGEGDCESAMDEDGAADADTLGDGVLELLCVLHTVALSQ